MTLGQAENVPFAAACRVRIISMGEERKAAKQPEAMARLARSGTSDKSAALLGGWSHPKWMQLFFNDSFSVNRPAPDIQARIRLAFNPLYSAATPSF